MNTSESMKYKGHMIKIRAREAWEIEREWTKTGETATDQEDWVVPDVVVEKPSGEEITLNAFEWLDDRSCYAKTKAGAIQKAFMFAQKAIDGGFIRKR